MNGYYNPQTNLGKMYYEEIEEDMTTFERYIKQLLTIKIKERKKTMAVQYRLYQNNNKTSSTYQKWYARAVWMDTVTIDDLAEKIEQRCTLTRADILAVIAELKVAMKEELQASNRVKIADLGTFKLSINTKPADSIEDFSALTNVKAVKVLFQPEMKVSAGMRIKPLLQGVKVTELPKNAVGATSDGANAGTDAQA